jgi:hypothetical protein
MLGQKVQVLSQGSAYQVVVKDGSKVVQVMDCPDWVAVVAGVQQAQQQTGLMVVTVMGPVGWSNVRGVW